MIVAEIGIVLRAFLYMSFPVTTTLWRKTLTEAEKRAFKEAKPKGKTAPKAKGRGKGKDKGGDARTD